MLDAGTGDPGRGNIREFAAARYTPRPGTVGCGHSIPEHLKSIHHAVTDDEPAGDVFSYAENGYAIVQRCQEELEHRAFSVERKNDGLSVSLEFTPMAYFTPWFDTSGDGLVGKMSRANLMTIPNIPKQLKDAPAFQECVAKSICHGKAVLALVETAGNWTDENAGKESPECSWPCSLRQKKRSCSSKAQPQLLDIWNL